MPKSKPGSLCLLLCLSLFAAGPSAAEVLSPECWRTLLSEQFRLGLLIQPDPAALDAIEEILQSAGSTSCRQTLTPNGTCVVAYPTKPLNLPPALRIRSLSARGKRQQDGNIFRSIKPVTPVYLEREHYAPHPGAPGLDQEVELLGLHPQPAWAIVPAQSGVATAVIDSGVQSGHPALNNLLSPEISVCSGPACRGGDNYGHGTNMSGIIAGDDATTGFRGVAWNTRILSLQTFIGPVSTDTWVAQAIELAIARHVAVIDASWYSPCPLPQVQAALLDAQRADIVVAVAAGDGGNNIDAAATTVYPAAYGGPNMIVVMGHDSDYQWPQQSNWGKRTVDIAAPNAAYTSNTCPPNRCYALEGTGTSDATAYVAGAAALLKSDHPTWSATWLKTQLMESAIVQPELVPRSKQGRRLMLDRALVGPLRVTAPAGGTHWKVSDQLQIAWTRDYDSSLCTGVVVSIKTDSSHEYVVGMARPGDQNIKASLQSVPPAPQAKAVVKCMPAEFVATSEAFSVDPVQ